MNRRRRHRAKFRRAERRWNEQYALLFFGWLAAVRRKNGGRAGAEIDERKLDEALTRHERTRIARGFELR